MARARNIKPGYFTNDVLCELEPLARILFAGLWTICDRAGRCEDRPKKIKAEVLPYDECDADEMLGLLANARFITRYEANGVRYIQVLTWEKHQNPHIKEANSIIPAPDETGARTVLGTEDQEPIPERAGLIPDSGSLIPDSKKEATPLVPEATPPGRYRVPFCPTDELVALYHRHLPALPAVEVMNDGRKRSLAARWRDVCGDGKFDKAGGLDWFSWFFERVAGSDFLMGRTAGKSGQHWRADFDFLTTPTKFAKVVEGRYHQGA